jgi:FkbM family methyltransferase
VFEGGVPKPPSGEDVFEWVDVLEAVDAARGSFTMIELGAGFGPWLTGAAVALRRHKPMPFRLVAVEPDPTHFAMIGQHLRDNGFVPENHILVQAAVTATGRPVHLLVSDDESWWGQAIAPDGVVSGAPGANARTIAVESVTLDALLEPLGTVDICNVDIQGSEADVIEAGLEAATEKIRRLHIGTHNTEVEHRLHRCLTSAGWCCLRSYPHGAEAETEFGRIRFVDGVQTWINPRVPADSPAALPALPASPPTSRRLSQIDCPVSRQSLRVSVGAMCRWEGDELVVTTLHEPWSYAAAVDVAASPRIDKAFAVELDVAVTEGTLYVALSSADLTELGEQTPVSAGTGPRTIALEGLKSAGRFTILFRNGPEPGTCRARVVAIRLFV